MSDLETLLLSPEQQRRYRKMLQERGLSASVQPDLVPRRPGTRVPLCSFQEPLWFMDRYLEGDVAHNVVYPMGLPAGEVDEGALRLAIGRLLERHEILRTTFELDGDTPVQIVHASMPVVLAKVDLTHLSAQQRDAEGWGLVDREAQRVFDLTQGPLIVFTLLVAQTGKPVLLTSLHHIVCDTWSVAIIDKEIRTHYDDIVHRRRWTLPEPMIQFGDYAVWQQRQSEQGAYRADQEYWSSKLQGAPVLQLPTDREIPEHRTYAADNQLVLIPPALLRRIKQFAHEQGATLYMVLLAAYGALLQRHTGQSDILVGTPHANRESEALRDMIGFTLNSLPLRLDLTGRPGFAELVQRVKATALAAYEHHAVPFQIVVESLGQDLRSLGLSRHALFRAFFSVQNIQWASEGPAQIDTGELHDRVRFTVPHPTTKYDLYMYLRERDGRVLGGLEYDRELFDASRIKRMIEHFLLILEQGIAAATPVRVLEILAGPESQQLRVTWNDTRRGAAIRNDIASCFHGAAARAEALALLAGSGSMTFAQLQTRSNQMANLLLGRGTGCEERIALIADRSLQMPVGLLGILKAGATCVPLDPSLPAERLEQLVHASGARTVLYDPESFDPRHYPVRAITLSERLEGLDARPPRVAIDSQQAAFVFFTSGSTGTPNAVVLTHANVLSAQLSDRCVHSIDSNSRQLLTTPVSSARLPGELLCPWLAGATVILAMPEGHRDPTYLGSMLENERITHVSLTPQILKELLAGAWLSRCPSLQWVYCVGEHLEGRLAAQFKEQSRAVLCNSYAQTEACPVAFTDSIEFADRPFVPVGRTAPNTSAFVLDDDAGLTPIGVVGEIYVGGAHVTRGYLDEPALTAEKYIPNPFAGSGERLYRTGDLGCWDEQGLLTLRGRRDQRVKIMSHRVDLREIERSLLQIEGVEAAAVVASTGTAGELALVAFVQPSHEQLQRIAAAQGFSPGPLSPEELTLLTGRHLQTTLQRRLPYYMVPSQIRIVDEMPLGRTGKVDHQRLLALASESPLPPAREAMPATAEECAIAAIWEEVLGLPPASVGLHTSFFELGGQSLLASRIIRRLRTELNVRLEVRHLFEAVTVAGLTDIVCAARQPVSQAGG